MKAEDIRVKLRTYYGTGEWALLFEVLDATGGRATRSADAVAMNTWPSRGLAIHGIEIKVSRSDWLGELKNPAKASAVAKYCDYWWLAAPAEIVQPGELPESWGFLTPSGNTMRISRQAVKNESAVPLDRVFVASLLRNAGRIDAGELDAKVEARIADEKAGIRKRVDAEVEHRTREYERLKTIVAEFTASSGIDISKTYSGSDLGKTMKAAEILGIGKWNDFAVVADRMREVAAQLEQAKNILCPTAERINLP